MKILKLNGLLKLLELKLGFDEEYHRKLVKECIKEGEDILGLHRSVNFWSLRTLTKN